MLGKERMYLQGAQFGFFVSDETKGVFFQFLNDVFRSKANKELAFQAELILINKQLQLSNAEKDKFFSVLAHDLRSPFNSLLGFTQMMVEDLPTMTEAVNTSRKGTAGEASTGLGLIITKEFVEKNGGRLWVESDEASKMIFSISLKREGFVVLEARTGLEAVEICRNTAGIDLVLMDINLPEMDGIEATHQIRQFNKNVVIIAQTAYSKEFPNFGQKLTDAGCNDYILKPIDNMDIKRLIQKHLPI
ncbi:MAG: response regulator [Bacteroidales bacterium]